MSNFLQLVKDRVVVYDGAMGTNIQKRNPTLDDYWGKENCSEVLVLSRPNIIRDIHVDFFRVGCDIVETNTFGGTGLVLGEFDLRDKVREINLKAAQLAREMAQQFSTKDKPRFVAGSMGPTTKLPSLGHIGWDAMAASYEEQASALIEGGVDVMLIETCQDLLQAKIATKDLAEYHKHFVKDYGIRIVGGCCGTTPEHLKAVVDAVAGVEPAQRDVTPVGAASSAYTSVPLDLEPKPLIVAEEMNTTTRVD